MFAELSEKAKALKAELEAFMSEHVYPNERELLAEPHNGAVAEVLGDLLDGQIEVLIAGDLNLTFLGGGLCFRSHR